MSFCSNCGQKLQESLKFCGNCGTPNPNASQISVPASQSTSSNRVLKTNSGEDYPQDTSKPSPVKETEKVAPNFESQNEIYNAIESLHNEATVILITHTVKYAKGVDFIYQIDKGKIVKIT